MQRRNSTRGVCALALVAAVIAPATSLAATGASSPKLASPSATAYPLVTNLGVTPQSRMVGANGDLFVSEGPNGSDVRVFSTAGKLLDIVTGETGATGMVASAHGKTLYVALAGQREISAINTKTFSHHEIAVQGCPTYLALTGGQLFYSYGCTAGDAGVASVDPSFVDAPVDALGGFASPPLLAGAASTLAVAAPGVSLATYSVELGGAISALASVDDANPISDLSMSPDGGSLVTAAPNVAGFADDNAATLSTVNTFGAGGAPSAVTVGPEGKHLAGGVTAKGDLLNFYDASSSTPIWQRFGASLSPDSWVAGTHNTVLPGSLTFDVVHPDEVFGLIAPATGTGVYLFASSFTPVASTLHLRVSRRSFHHPVVATARVPGAGQVDFEGTSKGTSSPLGAAQAHSKGIATLSFVASASGTMTAAFEGDLAHYPAQASKPFTVLSRSRVRLSGSYATKNGVELFHRRKDVRIVGSVMPVVAGRSVKAVLAYCRGGRWHAVAHLTEPLASDGTASLGLQQIAPHFRARVTISFAGDRKNGASTGISPTFEVT